MLDKIDLEKTLLSRNWDAVRAHAASGQDVIRKLTRRVYSNDGLIFWRAIEALGVAAKAADSAKPGTAVELCRRYFWSLNEESGGTSWNASYALASIIAHCPEQCGHFNWMFIHLLEDPSLEEGVLWGLIQIAQNSPGIVDPLEEELRALLKHANPRTRQLTELIYIIMSRSSGTSLNWQIAGLLGNQSGELRELTLYHQGNLRTLAWSEQRPIKSISYWTEAVELSKGSTDGLDSDLTVALNEDGVCWLSLGQREEQEDALKEYLGRWFPKRIMVRDDPGTATVRAQMQEYFAGRRQTFDFRLNPQGTPFQQRVWQELFTIPYGETRCYEEIAIAVGSPKGQRAVGMANHNNPLVVAVPCHRVIGKDGSLTGYGGGLDLKQYLLQLESRDIIGGSSEDR